MALVFLAISAFFCLRRRPTAMPQTAQNNSGQQPSNERPTTTAYSVGYSVAGNVTISESKASPKSNQVGMEFKSLTKTGNPDVVPRGKRKGIDTVFSELEKSCSL